MSETDFQGGKVVSFRLPHDVPKTVSNYLMNLKEIHKRKFSSEIADRFVQAIEKEALFQRPEKQLVIPFPENLTEEEKKFLKSDKTKALIGQLVVQLVRNPSEVPIQRQAAPAANNKQKDDTPDPSQSAFETNSTIREFTRKTFLSDLDD
ncbi:hypothetical protein G7L40_27045 (plasmid) [Paenibacillus polymyxa]|uniref:Uncharacterized protein n=2 Tax=Paenibacillus polymyxa TaxID=1406 RepID=A0A379LSV8_PAEPO|nr:hypothetical protein [Paenibacillus polymyxa]MBE7901108.1 hypothetical protein [Paenibacillus polymyxa]MBG9764557.1 hypothetical protein [Paenibacillus polymyxa]MCC3261691.1 hypothetical protein [Paenibacillus polymyxa]QPK56333.1 hypothetical protein G7035_27125 [Paenibacillus polymyxa]QPK61350.1 hypothetical protein G7L40_27045 [Paenibacillus polymyxa]